MSTIVADSDPHLTVLDFDELDLDAATLDRGRRAEAHVSRCAACAARRAAHGALKASFHAVFARTAASVTASARRSHHAWKRWLWLLAVPAAAAIVLVIGRGDGDRQPSRGASDPALGIKGGPLFEVFARRVGAAPGADGPTVVRVSDGMRLAPGDALRFVLFPGELPYGLIASVDGAGQVNIYYPFHGEESARLSREGALSIPGSIVLDGAPGPERLFAIYSARPIQVAALRQALKPIAGGGAPAIRGAKQAPIDGAEQSSLLFEKEDPR